MEDFTEFQVIVCCYGRYRRLPEKTEIFNVEIPANFQTDGASVPRLLWWFINPFGIAFHAAIVHDFRCEVTVPASGKWRWVKQKNADLEFYYNLKKTGTWWIQRVLAYYGVRLFDFIVRRYRGVYKEKE